MALHTSACALLAMLLTYLHLCRHFGHQVTQAWFLWAGGMSLLDLVSNTAPTGGAFILQRSNKNQSVQLSRPHTADTDTDVYILSYQVIFVLRGSYWWEMW